MMTYTHISRLLMVLAGSGSVLAQVPDPTRPPDDWLMPGPKGRVSVPVDSGVQTVILRPGGKSAAVINGQYVAVGEMIGDKRVIRITESEIVLKSATGNEFIKVIPAIEKISTNKKSAGKRVDTEIGNK
ncbi:MAG: hypothetical protein K9J74_11615 [Sulfuritalea sp.]|nr:hypothetical protein [Sulfuritalea sp.]